MEKFTNFLANALKKYSCVIHNSPKQVQIWDAVFVQQHVCPTYAHYAENFSSSAC